MRRAAAARRDVALIRRVITRPAGAGGEDYDAVTAAKFARMQAAGAFALTWQAHGLCYGIPRGAADSDGLHMVNLSRGVLPLAALAFPDLSVIHVDAAPEVLALRLAARGRETAQDIAARIARDAPLVAGTLPVTYIDNSGDLDSATAAFIAALNEMAPT